MAPPLVDPLLLANMESVAFVLQLICTVYKMKALDIALIDLHALLLHMLYTQSTNTASWYLWCCWKPMFYLCSQWDIQSSFFACIGLCIDANTNQQLARNLPSVQAAQSMHSEQTTASRSRNGHQCGCCQRHDCGHGLCNVPFVPPMQNYHNHTPLQYFRLSC